MPISDQGPPAVARSAVKSAQRTVRKMAARLDAPRLPTDRPNKGARNAAETMAG